MSNYKTIIYIDEPIEQEFSTDKDSNLKYIRTRLYKIGNPDGEMVLKIMNQAKTITYATSEPIPCNFSSDPSYVGIDDISNTSFIRFDFNGEAIRTGTSYIALLECDSDYIDNMVEEDLLQSWTQDTTYYKKSLTYTPDYVYKNTTLMTSVGSKVDVNSNTKYYVDGSFIWINFDPSTFTILSFPPDTNYISSITDYPKPTNSINGEITFKNNFPKYSHLVLQIFGRDYGED